MSNTWVKKIHLWVGFSVAAAVSMLASQPAQADQNTSSPWVIQGTSSWARWAPAPYKRWDVYNDLNGRVQLVGDPLSEGGIYFRNSDGSVGFRNVDANVNVSYPKVTATDLTVSDQQRSILSHTWGTFRGRYASAPFRGKATCRMYHVLLEQAVAHRHSALPRDFLAQAVHAIQSWEEDVICKLMELPGRRPSTLYSCWIKEMR